MAELKPRDGRPVVAEGTVVVFTDLVCGWSTLALHRFYRARSAAGLDVRVTVDLQLFALEDVNQIAVDFAATEAEKPVVGALAPDLGFSSWRGDRAGWPVTSLPANEAVHAAKLQSGRRRNSSTWRCGLRSGETPDA